MVYFSMRYVSVPPFCPNGERLTFVGVKEWKLIPPEVSQKLFPPDLQNDFPSTLEELTDPELLHKILTVHQFPSETIFVPSGWFHTVTNKGYLPSLPH